MLLVVKNPWLELILAGKKVWEIRGASTKVRGKIALSGGVSHVVFQGGVPVGFDDAGELVWSRELGKVDLGATVAKAIERNRQAFAVAEVLGQVSETTQA